MEGRQHIEIRKMVEMLRRNYKEVRARLKRGQGQTMKNVSRRAGRKSGKKGIVRRTEWRRRWCKNTDMYLSSLSSFEPVSWPEFSDCALVRKRTPLVRGLRSVWSEIRLVVVHVPFVWLGAFLLLQRSRVCAPHVRNGRSEIQGPRFCVVVLADVLALDLSEECSRELGRWFDNWVVMTTGAVRFEWARIRWWAFAGPATRSAAPVRKCRGTKC